MQGQVNPFIESRNEEKRKQRNLNSHCHRFSVNGLYMWGKPIREELYDHVRNYCKRNHIEFVLRDFHSGISEDCQYVERLPAFHIYYEEEWVMTFYESIEIETRLQQIIEEVQLEKKTQWFQFTFPNLLPTTTWLRLPRTTSRLTAAPTTTVMSTTTSTD
jgi:hypothetical protein